MTKIGADAGIEKVSDHAEMARAGVLSTPGLSVNGETVCAGRVPADSEVEAWILAAIGARVVR